MLNPHSPLAIQQGERFDAAWQNHHDDFVSQMSKSPEAAYELIRQFEWAGEISELFHKVACCVGVNGSDEQIGLTVRSLFDQIANGYANFKAEQQVL